MDYTKCWGYAQKKSCMLLILFYLLVDFHTVRGFFCCCSTNCFPSVLLVLWCTCPSDAMEMQSKAAVFISCTRLAGKMVEFLKMWFSQDWEYMPLASVGVGMCLKLRVCLICWIRSMHEANGLLQKQQRDAFGPVLHGQLGNIIWLALTVN